MLEMPVLLVRLTLGVEEMVPLPSDSHEKLDRSMSEC
jgi:hypothetical protein